MALTEGRAVGVLAELVDRDEILEAVAISTCNRTELYLYVADAVGAESVALGLLAREAGIPPTELVAHLYSQRGSAAAEHLLRRHRGPRLDDHRRERGAGPGQARLRARARRGRDRTDPQPPVPRRARRRQARPHRDGDLEGSMSIPSVAVELAQRTLGELEDRRVLVVGAGETAELTARAIAAKGVRAIFIANRHYDRAIGLAERFGGQRGPLRGAARAARATRTSSSPPRARPIR